MTRILVIEDEDMVRMTIKQILEKAGHEVDVASNGKHGLERQEANPADIVVTDIIMPEMDGVETTIELRSRFPQTKIIAISGGGRVHNLSFLEHAQQMGADVILPKPFTRDELLGAIAMTFEEAEV